MGFIWMIILGLIAGAIAKLIMPGRDPGGIIVTILLGIAGSVVGGFLWNMLTGGRSDGNAGLIGSIIGALILLALYRMIAGRRSHV
ncbi:MAG TPA: GlsB/YeaQ/YmgE family stress response membrane protein [Longimicrobium sp.]|jgi:uncharacterized membrane protein YeaQ/YmgE (transglycosylase-associated protein family)